MQKRYIDREGKRRTTSAKLSVNHLLSLSLSLVSLSIELNNQIHKQITSSINSE